MPGLFITFEGIEGSGKTTQIRVLEDFLKMRGRDVILTREPGGTRIGDQIRQILLNGENVEMKSLTELFLYGASRAQHVQEQIVPALENHRIVICDRYIDATTAYQGYAREIESDLVRDINRIATGGLKPDLTLLIDCPVEVGLRRAWERIDAVRDAQREDRLENEALEFHEKVRQGYLSIAKEEPTRFRIFDGTLSVEELHQQIIDEVMKWL